MLPIPPSVGETPPGRLACSFVSSYFSFKQNLMCPFKGDNSSLLAGEAYALGIWVDVKRILATEIARIIGARRLELTFKGF